MLDSRSGKVGKARQKGMPREGQVAVAQAHQSAALQAQKRFQRLAACESGGGPAFGYSHVKQGNRVQSEQCGQGGALGASDGAGVHGGHRVQIRQ